MIAFSLFFTATCSLKPIVIVPGAMRSRLFLNSTRKYNWYCPANENKHLAWLSTLNFVPPYLSCYMDYFALDYDNETGNAISKEGVTVWPDSFGGLNSVRGTGPVIFKYHFYQYLQRFITQLEKKGYKEQQNIFAAPYDFRKGVAHLGSYYDDLKALIEKAYENNNQQKVHIFCHSLGGYVSHTFLSEKTTHEWREKYIDGITMSAPSLSGSGTALVSTWRRTFPYVSMLKIGVISRFIESLGMFHIHIPNSFYYQNETLVITENNTRVTGKDIIPELKNHFKYEEGRLIAEKNLEYTSRPHKELDVRTTIIYNSGIKTTTGVDMTKGLFGKLIKMEGDGLVGSAGLKWVCNNWQNVTCHDFNSSSIKYIHQLLPRTQDALDRYFDSIFEGNVPPDVMQSNQDL